jgi:hypothetical protein
MNNKRLYLIVALLALPVASFAGLEDLTVHVPTPPLVGAHLVGGPVSAGIITFNVPVAVSMVPSGITKLGVGCRVGVGAVSGGNIWPAATGRGSNIETISITKRGYTGTVKVQVNARGGATHYTCGLQGYTGEPPFESQQWVSGVLQP